MRVETVHPRQNRVVIDTNVWLSAALSPAGAPARVVMRVLSSGVAILFAVIDRVERVRLPLFRTLCLDHFCVVFELNVCAFIDIVLIYFTRYIILHYYAAIKVRFRQGESQ